MKQYKVIKEFWILFNNPDPFFGDELLLKPGTVLEETGIAPADDTMKDTHIMLRIMPCGEKALINKALLEKCAEGVDRQ